MNELNILYHLLATSETFWFLAGIQVGLVPTIVHHIRLLSDAADEFIAKEPTT